MTIETSNTEPVSIIPGDTVKWTRTLTDYSSSAGWALSYELLNAQHRYEIAATADGAVHRVVVSAQITQTYAPGSYDWRARVTNADEVYTVATGRLTVAPSFGAAGDVRSHARRTLEVIEAVLEGRATSATAEYEINGRQPCRRWEACRTWVVRSSSPGRRSPTTRTAAARWWMRSVHGEDHVSQHVPSARKRPPLWQVGSGENRKARVYASRRRSICKTSTINVYKTLPLSRS